MGLKAERKAVRRLRRRIEELRADVRGAFRGVEKRWPAFTAEMTDDCFDAVDEQLAALEKVLTAEIVGRRGNGDTE